MKYIKLMAICLVIISLALSCKNKTEPTAIEGDSAFFGEKIIENKPIDVKALASSLEGFQEYEGQIKGKVESVCKVKGCWMNVLADDGTEVFVKFKDYGFFMPMDIEGSEVVMQGKGYYEVTTVDELRHYAEDEGKSKEEIAEITEAKKELKFMAEGVILNRE